MFDSVPDLTATMRANCPRGMGADCACAARIEARLEASESEGAILASQMPRMGVRMVMMDRGSMPHPGLLIAALLHHLTQPRVSRIRPMSRSGPEGDTVMSDMSGDGGMATKSRFDVSSLLNGLDETAGTGPSHIIDDLSPTGGTMRRAAAQIDEPVLA